MLNSSENKFNTLEQYIKFLSKNTENMDDLTKLRFIYVSLLSIPFSFNLDYSFGNKKTKKEIYNKCYFSIQSFNKLFQDYIVLCKSLSYIFEYLCNYFNLKVDTITEEIDLDRCAHVYNKVTINNLQFTVDPQSDLENIQSHSKTQYFGLDLIQKDYVISEELIKKIDFNIAYISQSSNYTEEYLRYLKTAITTPAPLEVKVQVILDNLNVYHNIESMKYPERKWYYERVIKSVLQKKDFDKLMIIDCYKKIDNIKEYFLCILTNIAHNQYTIDCFDNKSNKFNRLSPLEFNCMLKDIVAVQNIPKILKKTIT